MYLYLLYLYLYIYLYLLYLLPIFCYLFTYAYTQPMEAIDLRNGSRATVHRGRRGSTGGQGPAFTPTLPTKIIPTKLAWPKLSRKLPTDMRTPPLKLKIMPESNHPKSRILVRRPAVASRVRGPRETRATLALVLRRSAPSSENELWEWATLLQTWLLLLLIWIIWLLLILLLLYYYCHYVHYHYCYYYY